MYQRKTTWVPRAPLEHAVPGDNLADIPENVLPTPLLARICKVRNDIDLSPAVTPVGIASTDNLETYQPAIDLITQAILDKCKIIVALDYDCDGQTAGACMIKVLTAAGADVTWVVPSRLDDGYGLHVDLIKRAAPAPALVVSVDNGIANVEEVTALKELGYTVAITDHHLPEPQLPAADAIVNPKVTLSETDEEYMVPGVYVAAKTALHAAKQFVDETTWDTLLMYCNCLVGLGIVSDVIELHPVIRQQLKVSLAELNCCTFTGIRALLTMCLGDPPRPISTTTIAFLIAPKLNAAGRMGKAESGVQLLLMDSTLPKDINMAMMRANRLKSLNADRKMLEQLFYDEAVEQVPTLLAAHPHSIVLYGPEWHKGVLGIIAARIADEFHRPTIVLAGTTEELDGSGRSVDDFDLYTCLANSKDALISFGGHLVAAGVKVAKADVDKFRVKFDEEVAKLGIPTEATLRYDATATIEELTDVFTSIGIMNIEPTGNLIPGIVLRVLQVQLTELLTQGRTTKFVFKDQQEHAFVANHYQFPDIWETYTDQWVDILVAPSAVYFSGTTNPDYKLIDMKLHQEEVV